MASTCLDRRSYRRGSRSVSRATFRRARGDALTIASCRLRAAGAGDDDDLVGLKADIHHVPLTADPQRPHVYRGTRAGGTGPEPIPQEGDDMRREQRAGDASHRGATTDTRQERDRPERAGGTVARRVAPSPPASRRRVPPAPPAPRANRPAIHATAAATAGRTDPST